MTCLKLIIVYQKTIGSFGNPLIPYIIRKRFTDKQILLLSQCKIIQGEKRLVQTFNSIFNVKNLQVQNKVRYNEFVSENTDPILNLKEKQRKSPKHSCN